MHYTLSIEIDLPIADVVKLYDNPDNWAKWQQGFVKYESVVGQAGKTGSETILTHMMAGKPTQITEKVELNNLPAQMICIYQSEGTLMGAWNRVDSQFIALDDHRTCWQFACEFRFGGLLKLMALFAPNMFRKASLKEMNNFKHFAEKAQAEKALAE